MISDPTGHETFHPVEHIPLFHSTIPFHHSSPVIVDYRLAGTTQEIDTKINQWTVPLEWNGGMEYWNDP